MHWPLVLGIFLLAAAQLSIIQTEAKDPKLNDLRSASFVHKTVPALEKPIKFTKAELAKLKKSLQPKLDFRFSKSIKRNSIKKQIIGGNDSNLGDWPWQAFIYMDNSYLCGGSFILLEWILTAAHCVVDFKSFVIYLGTVHRYSRIDEGRQVFFSNVTFPHPSYSRTYISDDIALIRLPTSFNQISYSINIIALPKYEDATKTYAGTVATAIGYGKDASGVPTDRLKNVNLTVMPNVECAAIYGTNTVKSSTLCTYATPTKTTCSGDSGGPLVHRPPNSWWVVIGVTSFTTASACGNGPAGFARVTSFLGWIDGVTSLGYDPTISTTTTSTTTSTTTTTTTTTTSTTTTPTTTTSTTTTSTTTTPTTTTSTTTASSTTTSTTTSTSTTTTTPTTTSSTTTTSTSTTPTTTMSTTTSTTTKTPTTTKSTKPTTTKKTTTKKTTTPKPMVCKAAAHKLDTMHSCCNDAPKNIFSFASTDKTCGGKAATQDFFNKFLINKIQNDKANNTLSLDSTEANNLMKSAACFVNCYLEFKNMVNGTKYLIKQKFMEYINSVQNAYWAQVIDMSFDYCASIIDYEYSVGYYNSGKCHGRSTAIIQCIHMRMIQMCPSPGQTQECTTKRTTFNTCAQSMFKGYLTMTAGTTGQTSQTTPGAGHG